MGKSMDGQKNFRLALCFRGSVPLCLCASVPLCLCASVSVSLMTDEENSRLAWAREGTRAKWYCKQGEEGEPGTG